MGSHHKRKKGTDDVIVAIADIKDDAEQTAIRTVLQTGLEFISAGNPRIPFIRTCIDYVNVTETTDASQTGGGGGDIIPPAQVIGLSATGVSDTVINLFWTANTEPDLDHYDVYRGTVSGFTVTLGVTVPTGTSFTNSYSDTGRTASTTYYYKVGAVDSSDNRGAVSTQASATTLAPGSFLPSLELHLDSSFTDTSPNNLSMSGANSNGFFLPGKFGTAAWRCNYPTDPAGVPPIDYLLPSGTSHPASLQMDTTVGFSISVWIFPQDLSALGNRRVIIENNDEEQPNPILNQWSIQIDSTGKGFFFVKKGGVEYKAEKTGFVTGSWQHIAATFNGSTNTAILYRDAVAGTSSVAASEYASPSLTANWFTIGSGVGGSRQQNSYYEGYIDEVRYYKSVVLTPTQVTNLKNTNTP